MFGIGIFELLILMAVLGVLFVGAVVLFFVVRAVTKR